MNYKKKYLKLNCSQYRHKIKIIPEAEAITNVLNVLATFCGWHYLIYEKRNWDLHLRLLSFFTDNANKELIVK